MRFSSRLPAFLLSLLMLVGGQLVFVALPSASADTYDPPPGLRLNNPTGTAAQRVTIRRHILRSIRSVPKGEVIRVMSWNIRSPRATKALAEAHKRGVTVQVLMDRYNAYAHEPDPYNQIPADPSRNDHWFWLRGQLTKGNAKRKPAYRSWARLCAKSCRGRSGLPHVKMYLFTKVHKTRNVVMYSSGNLTDAASNIQWNDMYTVRENPYIYTFARQIFQEMQRDRPVGQQWRRKQVGRFNIGFFPWKGKGAWGDPVGRTLGAVKCFGAAKNVGYRGRTVIRIAQTGQVGNRGVRLARQLKGLWNRGCDIRLVYSLLAPKAEQIYRSNGPRGPMPIRQIAQDFDGDFIYDRYLHLKAMTISGVIGNTRNADFTWNGSANWAGYTLDSDEVYTRMGGPIVRRQYNQYINRLFRNPPRSARGRVPDGFARMAGIDPYAKLELN